MKIKLVLVLAMVVLFSCKSKKAENQKETDSRGYIVNVGDQAPDFEIEYTDGRKIMLSDLKGKLVMLQFTASWCSVCRKEMPFIESEIWQKNKDNPDFVLLGIDYKETSEITKQFAKDMKISYPLTLDTDGKKFDLFCGPDAGVTRNILVDKDGTIVLLTRLFEKQEFDNMVAFINNKLINNID